MNLPNQITIGRLALAVVFCVFLSLYDARRPAQGDWLIDLSFWIFVVAAATDFIDGYLARKHNQVTSLGRILDPFVDKVLVGGAFILLAGPNFVDVAGHHVSGMYPWMVVIIVARELLVSTLRGASESQGVQYASRMAGKVKMWVQSITVGWILVSLTHPPGEWWLAARHVLIWLTLLVTVASMLSYVAGARHLLAERART